jgi:hypothetical protein
MRVDDVLPLLDIAAKGRRGVGLKSALSKTSGHSIAVTPLPPDHEMLIGKEVPGATVSTVGLVVTRNVAAG